MQPIRRQTTIDASHARTLLSFFVYQCLPSWAWPLGGILVWALDTQTAQRQTAPARQQKDSAQGHDHRPDFSAREHVGVKAAGEDDDPAAERDCRNVKRTPRLAQGDDSHADERQGVNHLVPRGRLPILQPPLLLLRRQLRLPDGRLQPVSPKGSQGARRRSPKTRRPRATISLSWIRLRGPCWDAIDTRASKNKDAVLRPILSISRSSGVRQDEFHLVERLLETLAGVHDDPVEDLRAASAWAGLGTQRVPADDGLLHRFQTADVQQVRGDPSAGHDAGLF